MSRLLPTDLEALKGIQGVGLAKLEKYGRHFLEAIRYYKTDAHDAECVAKVLLSKMDTLLDAQPNDLYWALSEMVTKWRSLVKACMALKNRVHNYISHHYPSYRKFFRVFECKTALEF